MRLIGIVLVFALMMIGSGSEDSGRADGGGGGREQSVSGQSDGKRGASKSDRQSGDYRRSGNSSGDRPSGGRRSGAICADYPNQAAAQRAADTFDADGDGLYCESLPCPCSDEMEARGGGAETRSAAGREADDAGTEAERRAIEAAKWQVTRVVDGDTIAVRREGDTTDQTLRLIGIDTPETRKPGVGVECGGRAATRNMKEMVLEDSGRGEWVKLETDRSQDFRDRYGRLLVYVRTTGRERDLAEEQVRAGFADVYVYGRVKFSRWSRYEQAKQAAKSGQAGSWGACSGDFHSEQ